MTRPRFDADIIAALRNQVVAHNQAGVGRKVNLGELKKIYAQGWRGEDPAARAMGKVAGHLVKLAKAFDESKHQRDQDGRFKPKGGQSSIYRDVAAPADDRALRDQNSGYASAQTAVIPETRYSLFGPAVFAAAGVARGAMRGAFPEHSKFDPMWAAGKLITRTAAGGVAQAGVAAARGVKAIERRLWAGKPVDPAVDRASTQAALRSARDMGRGVSDAAWRAVDKVIDEAPLLGLRRHHRNARAKIAAEGLRGGARIAAHAGRILGGAAKGAIIPGAAMGYGGYQVMNAAGPYLDALFPRRVEKMAKVAGLAALPEAAEALRKAGYRPFRPQALAKVAAQPAAAEALEKAFIRPAMQGAKRLGQQVMGAIRAPLAPRAPSMPTGAQTTGQARARAAIRAGVFSRPGKAAIAGIGISAGAGAGAAAGYGAEQAREYYRDKDGKFTSKDRAVSPGWSAVGGAAGAVAGALGAAALIAGNRRAAIQTAIRGVRAATPGDIRSAQQQAYDAALKGSKEKIESVRAAVASSMDAMKRASTDPVTWNRWRVDSDTADMINQRLGSAEFWGGALKLRPAAKRAFSKVQSLDSLKNIGLTPAQMNELRSIVRAAEAQKAGFEKKVADFNAAAAKAVTDRDAARTAEQVARKARDEASASLVGNSDAEAIKGIKARMFDLDAEIETAGKAFKQADEIARRYAEVMANPMEARPGVAFPQAPNPWKPSEFVSAMPTSKELQDRAQLLEAARMQPVYAAAARKADAAAAEARAIALATVSSLNRARHPGVVGGKIAQVSAMMGRHMAAAKADVATAGGTVNAAVRRALGMKPADAGQPGAMAGFYNKAKGKLVRGAKGLANEAMERPLRTVGMVSAAAAPAAVVFGLADYTQDGQLNFSLKNANLRHVLDPKTAPRPVVRVFHAGTRDQVVMTGVVGSNKKGERIFISGEYRDANGAVTQIEPMAPLKEVSDLLAGKRNQQGGGAAGGAAVVSALANAPAQERKGWDEAIGKARQVNAMETFGEGDLAIQAVRSDMQVPEVQSEAGKMINTVGKAANAELEKKSGQFGKGYNAGAFYSLAAAVLSDPSAAVLPTQLRATFLRNNLFSPTLASAIGTANSSADTLKVITDHMEKTKLVPYWQSPEQERTLRQAFRVINRHLPEQRRMNADHLADLDAVINRHRRGGGGAAKPPGGEASVGGGAGGGPAAAPSAAPLNRSDFLAGSIDQITREYQRLNAKPPKNLEAMVSGAFSATERIYDGDPTMKAMEDEERWKRIQDDVVGKQLAVIRSLRRAHGATTLRKAMREEDRGYFEPVRFGGTLGGAVGSQAGWAAASRFMPVRVRTAGKVGRFAFRLGSAVLGGAGGAAAGEAIGRRPYESRGVTAPPSWQPPSRSASEEGARTIGSIAGGIGGTILGARGGAARAFGMGIAGQLGGEEAGAGALKLYERTRSRYESMRGAAPAPVRPRPPRTTA